jgi:hypothetical protein
MLIHATYDTLPNGKKLKITKETYTMNLPKKVQRFQLRWCGTFLSSLSYKDFICV